MKDSRDLSTEEILRIQISSLSAALINREQTVEDRLSTIQELEAQLEKQENRLRQTLDWLSAMTRDRDDWMTIAGNYRDQGHEYRKKAEALEAELQVKQDRIETIRQRGITDHKAYRLEKIRTARLERQLTDINNSLSELIDSNEKHINPDSNN